jgi:hypothetical protein
MPRREFTSQKALQAHAEQTGNVCVLEGIAIRQRQLSPDQYEIVDVRTSRGVLRSALLIPKAVLKALCEAEAPFREARRAPAVERVVEQGANAFTLDWSGVWIGAGDSPSTMRKHVISGP